MNFLKNVVVFILTLEAKIIINKYKPFVIAITGSVGKTSTKDAVYHIVKDTFPYVRKSEKSMNSEIGLPLTIIGLPNAWKNPLMWIANIFKGFKVCFFDKHYPDCLVLEVGADHPRDIQKVSKWLKVDIAIISKIGATPVHVEFFKSPDHIFEEKASLLNAIKKGGHLILFADEPKMLTLADRVMGKDIQVITYGMSQNASIKASDYKIIYKPKPVGMSFIVTGPTSVPRSDLVLTGVIGQSFIYSILAGIAVGNLRGVSIEHMIKSFEGFEYPHGRMNILSGLNDSVIIDDTYNSSPDAVVSAFETLKAVSCSGRKIAVLGDMMELGKYSSEEHRKIGKMVFDIADILVTVGVRSKAGIVDEALKSGMSQDNVYSFDDAISAGEFLKSFVRAGDIILVKGSQSTRLEKTVSLILDPRLDPKKLLVRQEEEWLRR